MAISISASSSQSTNAAANQSTVNGSGSMTLTVGSWSGLQQYGRVYIGDTYYDSAGYTSMSQGGSWSWSASRTYNHDANSGYRGDVGVSVSHWVSGTTYHQGSATAATQGAIDYDRSANSPYYNNITRTSPTNIYVTYARTGSVNGPTTYVLERATDAGMSQNYTTFGEGNQTVDSTTNYYYRMYAYGTEGGNKYSGVYGPYYGVPTAPTNVVGTASSSVSGRITVSWNVPSATNGGITNYYVYRGGTYIGQTGNANTSYIDDGLTKGTSYSYTVVAYNAAGASVTSSASTATQAPGTPYAPTLSTAVASTDTFGKVSLSWTAPSTAVGTMQNYYMYAVFGGVIEKTVSTGTNVTSGVITGLDERKVYTFYVRGRNQFSVDNGTPGDQSNTIDRKSPGPPSAPTALSSSAPFFPPGTIDLSWTAPSDVGTEGGTITGYNIYLAGNPTPVKSIYGTGTTTTVEDLIPATSYTFQIRARNAIADIVGTFSDLSNSTTATAQGEPNAPVGLTVVSDPIVAGRLILTWEPPVGYNTGFRVYTGADVLVANIAVPRLEIDGLTPNTSYSYKVRARNPLTDLTGSPGGPASATVAGVVGASSTQTVPSISVSNTTNNTFVGTHSLISTTATTMSYAKTASNIPFASVPTNGGSTVNNTNTNLNGPYTVTVVGTQATSTELTYPRAGADIPANTSTPSGTMYNNTNVVFNGNYEVLAFPAPDPVLKTVSYSKVGTNISSRVASGPITNNSNAVYNGEYVVSDVTETTITYPKSNLNIAESDAFGIVYNKTNQDIFNGTFTLTDTPDHKTVEYSTGDLTYGENLITNPSFETVQTGATILRTNLVSNPNFETNVTGWSGSSASIARSSDRAYSGSHSGLVTPGSTSGSVSISSTTVSGQVYTASVWVYATEATSLRMTVDSPATNGTTVAVTADTWTRLSVSFTANTTTTAVGIQTVGTTQPFYVDAVLLEQTSELRPFFDGGTTDALGWDYGWSGTANASTSTAKGGVTTVRTNYYTNPSFEADTVGTWTNEGTGSITVSKDTSVFRVGTASAKFVCSSGMRALSPKMAVDQAGIFDGSLRYQASVWVKGEAGKGIILKVYGYNNSTKLIETTVNVNTTGAWQQASATLTIGGASVNFISIVVSNNTLFDTAHTFNIDSVVLTPQNTYAVNSAFDGSYAPAGDYVYAWEGTAHASRSFEYAPNVVGAGGVYAAVFQSSEWHDTGNTSLKIVPNGSSNSSGAVIGTYDSGSGTWGPVAGMVPGKTYTVSAKIRLANVQTGPLSFYARTLQLSYYTSEYATVSVLSNQAPNVAGVTHTLTAKITIPADAGAVLPIYIYNGMYPGENSHMYVDSVLLIEGDYTGTYFDGDTDATATTWPVVYSWAGTPHASTSIREVGGTLPSVGAELVLPYGEAARVNSKAQLQIQYRSGWIG